MVGDVEAENASSRRCHSDAIPNPYLRDRTLRVLATGFNPCQNNGSPVAVAEDIQLSFESLKLDARLLNTLTQCGFTAPTEIQSQAIPAALAGKDLMASAQTGTGKTAAFVLPSLQRLLTPSTVVNGRGPRVVILTPTRELATQVCAAIDQLSAGLRLRCGAVVGGTSYFHQEKLLRSPLDVLVATPGRMLDHMQRGRVDFSRLEVFILDEADRMLDMGFIDDVEKIAAAAPKQRQTLLFSATLEGPIARIAKNLLTDPVRIQVAGVKVQHSQIQQSVYRTDNFEHKRALLNHFLTAADVNQAIVFTATKRGAEQLAMDLQDQGVECAPLHGDMPQAARSRTIERMHRGHVRVLIATDVAARGLDVKGITHVINFDMPNKAEDYVHRIGRTGRAGATGVALSFLSHSESGHLHRIERLTGKSIDRGIVEGLEPKRGESRPGGPGKPAGARFGHKPGGPSRSGTGRGEHRPAAAAAAPGAKKPTWRYNNEKRRPREDGDQRRRVGEPQ